MLYDFYMGIELNPRFGEYWDFKLFHNGRPGIVAWTLMYVFEPAAMHQVLKRDFADGSEYSDLSYIAMQYQSQGFITNSIVIVSILHAVYVLDLFFNEDWYF